MSTNTIFINDTLNDQSLKLNSETGKNSLYKKPYSISTNTFDLKKYISPNDYASNATYYFNFNPFT